MKIAFSLFKYFPYGGLQKDLLKLVRECLSRDHEVRVYIGKLEYEFPEKNCELVEVECSAITNHGGVRRFSNFVDWHLANNHVDLVVGMNKMPGLDVYYAGDSCYQAKAMSQRNRFYRLLPRYRQFLKFERSVFDETSKTRILTISDMEIPKFQKYYHTRKDRFFDLPPGITPFLLSPKDRMQRRIKFRSERGITELDRVLLFVGSGFKKKGLDRAISGLASIKQRIAGNCRLLVVGDDNPKRHKGLAKSLGIANDVDFLGGYENILDFLCGADGLVLPAYDENAGMVILESLVAGLPVLATENCGYAGYVAEADCGLICPNSFDQSVFNSQLIDLITNPRRDQWVLNGLKFAKNQDLYRMAYKAVDYFEQFLNEDYPK